MSCLWLFEFHSSIFKGFPGGTSVKNIPANAGDLRDSVFGPWVRKMPWIREWLPTPVFLPGEYHV